MTSKSISRMTNGLVVDYVNTLRTLPKTFVSKFLTISKALQRAKKREQGKQLEELAQSFDTIKPLDALNMSDGLTLTADSIVRQIVNTGDENYKMDQALLNELIEKHFVKAEGIFYILDFGDLDNLITRILISESDPQRTNQAAIFSTEYKFIGAASRQFLDEDLNLVILAKELEERKDIIDYDELAQIFNALDDKDSGFIDPVEIYAKLLEYGFEEKNPSLVELFRRLKENKIKSRSKTKGIDYETFKLGAIGMHVKKPIETKEDWKKVFGFFVDDAEAQTISIGNLKRILSFLEEEIPNKEFKKLMKWGTSSGTDMTFDEFYDIMTVKLPEEIDE